MDGYTHGSFHARIMAQFTRVLKRVDDQEEQIADLERELKELKQSLSEAKDNSWTVNIYFFSSSYTSN